MAVDMFLKIEGVPGEAQDEGTPSHKDEIDVLAWSWGLSQSGTLHAGSGGGAGKVNVQDVSITKWVDRASPALMHGCCTGKHYTKATLTVRKAGEKPLEYIIMIMTDVMVTAVSTGGSGGEDRLTENITLNFREESFEYVKQSVKGAADVKPKLTWNNATNKGSLA